MAEKKAELNKSIDLSWKLLGTTTGATTINLPAEYHELYIEVFSNNLKFTGLVSKDTIGEDIIICGYYITNPLGAMMLVTKTATTINLKQAYVSGTDRTAQSTTTFYYR